MNEIIIDVLNEIIIDVLLSMGAYHITIKVVNHTHKHSNQI